VAASTMDTATRLGMDCVHAGRGAYQPPEAGVKLAEHNVADAGCASVRLSHEVADAVRAAEFVYADLWWRVDQEDEIPQRRAAFMPRYQVNEALMARAPADARFMHCLPASRGVEVTDEVADSPQSVIFDQAENRLHAEKAILVWTTAPDIDLDISPELQALHAGRIREQLGRIGRRAD